MTPSKSHFHLRSLKAPMRRVLAIDIGTRRIKLLLAQNTFGQLRILQQEMLDIKEEGLLSPEEIKTHLLPMLQAWGHPALALTLPEQVSTSQRMDLPIVPDTEVDDLVANETIKLSGVSESRIIYDFFKLKDVPKNKQQFWVTLCPENEIRERVLRLGIEREVICEITTTGNALAAAFLAIHPKSPNAILVHLGAQSTVVVAIVGGELAHSVSYPMGGDFFTRSLLRSRQGSEDAAEKAKLSLNLLEGPSASPEFTNAVEAWAAELTRQLQDWARQNPALAGALSEFELIGHGAAFSQPGFKDFLAAKNLRFGQWPASDSSSLPAPDPEFEIAFGTALQALDHSGPHISLLPADYRRGWEKRITRQRIDFSSLALAVACFVVLLVGTWLKVSITSQKQEFLSKLVAANHLIDANASLTEELLGEYEALRQLLAMQQNTTDLLNTLALLEKTGTNENLWFVLIADQQSYFSHPASALSTNRPGRTNVLGPALAPPGLVADFLRTSAASTNLAGFKPGLIAELCISGEPDSSRHTLSELVNSLKQHGLFSKVDLLSEDLRRSIADPKVVLPERHYAIAFDYADIDLHQPIKWKRPGPAPRNSGPYRTSTGSSGANSNLPRPLL